MSAWDGNGYTQAPAEPPRDLIASFTLEGEPVSKARARFTNYGGKTRTYTPEKTLTAEKTVAAAFRFVAPEHVADIANSYSVTARFYNGTRQRRDVDNMLKLILDGLNKIAWGDDNQVTEVTGQKILTVSEKARTEVEIFRLGPIDRRLAYCIRCGTEYESYPSQAKRQYCTLDCYHEELRLKRVRKCELCDAEYETKPGGAARFCSIKCRSQAGRVTVHCTACGVAFTKQASIAARSANHFHSAACQQEHQRPRRATQAQGVCIDCGEPTSKKQYIRCAQCVRPGVAGKPLPLIEYRAGATAHMELRIEEIR